MGHNRTWKLIWAVVYTMLSIGAFICGGYLTISMSQPIGGMIWFIFALIWAIDSAKQWLVLKIERESGGVW